VWTENSKSKASSTKVGMYDGDKNPNYKGGGKDCICKECGKSFKIMQSEVISLKRQGLYCSKECNYDFKRKTAISISQKKLNYLIARRLSCFIKKTTTYTSSKWLKILGYTMAEFKSHIASQFLPGMTWSNYGDWHIDHVKPMSYFTFDKNDLDELVKCWSLDNLQPLWKKDNLSKGGCNTKINIKKYGKRV
jgi:hypothetical protein